MLRKDFQSSTSPLPTLAMVLQNCTGGCPLNEWHSNHVLSVFDSLASGVKEGTFGAPTLPSFPKVFLFMGVSQILNFTLVDTQTGPLSLNELDLINIESRHFSSTILF